jgi:peptide/nickel transport system substrate-binding protein
MRTPRGLTAAALLLTFTVLGCANPMPNQAESRQAERPAVSGPKRITAAIRGVPKTASVMIDSAGAGRTKGLTEVENLLNAGLVMADADAALRPRLAEAVPTIENGLWKLLPDGRMETVWKLRPDARWHDGNLITAEDLVFTTTVARDKELAIVYDPAYDYVDSVEARDAATFVATWTRPFIEADTLLSRAGTTQVLPIPRHLLERAYVHDRASFLQLPYWNEGFVGSGPFKLREWVTDSHLLVEANDAYVLGRPKLDQIEVRFIGDANVTMANVLANALDITLRGGLSFEQGLVVRDQWRDGRMDRSVAGVTGLFPQFMNPSPAVVADARFRRALAHAMDRQVLSDTLQTGSPVGHSAISPNDPEYPAVERSIVRYDYDPRRAIQLIDEMGSTRGADGIFSDARGERLAVKVQTTTDDLREKMILIIGDYWQQVGVQGELFILPRQAANDRQLRTTFPAFEATQSGSSHPTAYRSSQIPLPENNFSGTNRSRYSNAELDELIDRYFVTIPVADRNAIMARMVNHLTERAVHIGIFYIMEPVAISNRVQNVLLPKGQDNLLSWNVHEWDVR